MDWRCALTGLEGGSLVRPGDEAIRRLVNPQWRGARRKQQSAGVAGREEHMVKRGVNRRTVLAGAGAAATSLATGVRSRAPPIR